MNAKELIFQLIGVEVDTEDLDDLREKPQQFVKTEEEAKLLQDLFLLLRKTEDTEESQ
jgi:hypothetical protein